METKTTNTTNISKALKRERLERMLPIAANAVLEYFPTSTPTARLWADRVVLYATKLAEAMDAAVENDQINSKIE